MSAFVDALDRYLTAREGHAYASRASWYDAAKVEAAERELARAGDVLERELRQMMRQEVRNSGAEVDADWLRGFREEMGYD